MRRFATAALAKARSTGGSAPHPHRLSAEATATRAFVVFGLVEEGHRAQQYGLIAEEVAGVYPDLVAYERDGKPYTVKYQYLTTMLLNEVQKQHRKMETQAQTIEELRAENQKSQQRNEELEQRVSRLESLIGRQTETAENLSPQKKGR